MTIGVVAGKAAGVIAGMTIGVVAGKAAGVIAGMTIGVVAGKAAGVIAGKAAGVVASLSETGNHLTFMPGLAPASGVRMKISSPPGPAASTMPSDTPKRILRGARFATITVSLPTRSSGW